MLKALFRCCRYKGSVLNNSGLGKIKYLLVVLVLSGCSITPPKEYVGTWKNGGTNLKIEESGQLKYRASDYSISFPITEVSEDEISGSLPFIFSLTTEGPPTSSEAGLVTLIVRDEKLFKQAPPPLEPKKDSLYDVFGKASIYLLCAIVRLCD